MCLTNWLSAARTAVEFREPAVLVSLVYHPPLLLVPLGPVCVVTQSSTTGSLHLGAAREPALEACARLIESSMDVPRDLSLTLNPWAGRAGGHIARLQLRRLGVDDQPALSALAAALARGQSAALQLPQSELSVSTGGEPDVLPLSAQASAVTGLCAQFAKPDHTVLAIGAGVLAHRVVECLADTPVRVAWAPLGGTASLAVWPTNAVLLDGQFVPGVSALPQGCHVLVMTHDHALDIDLCHRLLAQGQAASIGMVGSYNKRRQLHRALLQRGLSEADIRIVRCPIGGANHSNLEHASVAITAELLGSLRTGWDALI